MLEYLSYTVFFGVLLCLLLYAYIRSKYGFWSIQPVYHVYDLSYMWSPPGILDDYLPKRNKYTNFRDVATKVFRELTPVESQRFVHLIRTQYLQNKDNQYLPSKDNILPYFTGHFDKCFVSFHTMPVHRRLKDSKIISDEKLTGVITSRPLHVSFLSAGVNMRAYYVDYLCVHADHRKKGVAQQLIQTHHYNQRHINKDIVVSLFKREEELTGIVPLCAYTTYGFSANTWRQPSPLSAAYSIVSIGKENLHLFFDFFQQQMCTKFELVVYPEISQILELVNTKNIFIEVVVVDGEMVAAYFLRKTCVQIEKGIEVLSCFGSFCGKCEEQIFIQGYKVVFWKIAAEHHFGYCAIEDISDNDKIIRNILQKTSANITSPTAYFFYNFAYPTFPSNQVLFLS